MHRLGSQDLNLDSQIQSLESYRWTTPHQARRRQNLTQLPLLRQAKSMRL